MDKSIPTKASKEDGSRDMKQPPTTGKAAVAPNISGKAAVAPKAVNPFTSMMTASSAIRNVAVIGPKSTVNATPADTSKQSNGGRGKKGYKTISEKLLDMVAKLPRIPTKRENYSEAAKLAVVKIVAECGSVEGAVNIFKRQKVDGYQRITWQSADRWVRQSAKVRLVLFVF